MKRVSRVSNILLLCMLCTTAWFAVGCSKHASAPIDIDVATKAVLNEGLELSPAYSIVVLESGQTRLNYQVGVSDLETHTPVDSQTAFYIASQTKAFIGALAFQLHQQNIFSLDITLQEVWGEELFAQDSDLANITMRDLLHHQIPINAFPLTFLEAYVSSVPSEYYLSVLLETATPREPGFQYDNLGYSIYAQALYSITGKTWQHWLEAEVFRPLEMTESSHSIQQVTHFAQPHELIAIGEWNQVPAKPDTIMHAAGGLVVSSQDMGIWLQNMLTEEFEIALAESEVRYRAYEHPSYKLRCDGYSLGWNLCYLKKHKIYIHGGGYLGSQSLMALVPERDLAIAVAANSDHMTHWLNREIIVNYIQAELGTAFTARAQEKLVENIHEYRDSLLGALREGREQSWEDLTRDKTLWAPDSSALSKYVGTYVSESLPIQAELVFVEGELKLVITALERSLRPITPELFAAAASPLSGYKPLSFKIDSSGHVTSLEFMETVLTRR